MMVDEIWVLKIELKNLFKQDKMNYAALSNKSPVIHTHIIPRYKDAREGY